MSSHGLICLPPSAKHGGGGMTECTPDKYLGVGIPLAACLVSSILLLSAFFSARRRSIRGSYDSLATQDPEGDATPRNLTRDSSACSRSSSREGLEALALLGDLAVGIWQLFEGKAVPFQPASFTAVLFSAYLLALLIGRSAAGAFRRPVLILRLRSHSAALYAVQWLCLLVVLLSLVLVDQENVRSTSSLAHFCLYSALSLIYVTTPGVPVESYKDSTSRLEASPEQNASLLSQITLSWSDGLVWKAFRATLEATDLYQIEREQTAGVVAPSFLVLTTATASLLWRLFQFLKYEILVQGAWATLLSLTIFMPAALLRFILAYLEDPSGMSHGAAWVCVGGLLVSGVITAVAEAQCQWVGTKLTTKLRAVLLNELYSKALRKRMARSPRTATRAKGEGASHASDGNILNLVSADVEMVCMISNALYLAWVNFPVQIAIAIYLLYQVLGVSGVIGIGIMVALLPLNGVVSNMAAAAQRKVLTASDARLHSSTEVLNNIRTIKYCGWENAFMGRILGLRTAELRQLRHQFIWWSISQTLFHSLSFIISILTFFIYTVVFGNELRTSIAFPALAMFGVLRMPLDRMEATIMFLQKAYVSIVRMEKFLRERETGKYSQLSTLDNSSIGFDKATFVWPDNNPLEQDDEQTPQSGPSTPASQFQLRDLQIRFKEGSLNVICGASGSGKSSLLLALLGEMDLLAGQVLFPAHPTGGVAYCPQEPWILNRSIRANILLGQPFHSYRYKTVLAAVALPEDLATFDQGDRTLAGENGSRLSGGQKQRVALARALYSRSNYFLLDDCLSAVDSRTAKHIFFHALKGSLMRKRTCILATHHTKLALPHSQHVVLLDDGTVSGQGTTQELVSAGLLEADILQDVDTQLEVTAEPSDLDLSRSGFSNGTSQHGSAEQDIFEDDDPSTEPDAEDETGYKESKREGAVQWHVLQILLQAMGARWYWLVVLFGFVAQQLAALTTNLWVKEWAHRYDIEQPEVSIPEGPQRRSAVNAGYYIGIYTAICLAYALISFLRDGATFYGSLKASSRIYKRLLSSILHARLTFFDQTPIGQIMNRFSNDTSTVDQSLPGFMISAVQLTISIVMSIGLVTFFIPVFLPAAVIICLVFYCIVTVYINSSRDLKRIQSVARSPLYQQLGETLSGFVSIRAYDCLALFTDETHAHVDRLHQAYVLLVATKLWLSIRVGSLSALISFLAGSFALWSMGSLSPGAAGLVLTYAATFTENVMWFAQIYSLVQQNLNSVERISEYTELEQEAAEPVKKPSLETSTQWPSEGHIRFQRYTARYSEELEPVLKDVSFEARSGQRVAIVGRTGAGKSTLTLSLIRALEADEGSIEIDGVDVASIPLERLRHAVTVVPQDPSLFEGTIRDNLDPLHQYTDADVIDILRTVRLLEPLEKDSSSPQPAGQERLDHPADALSRGQRQLLCIARALLRRSRVLVLDEATASIDHATDALIQDGLRAGVSSGTTVLTIAHRLQTIADYDWVVVLDAGRVIEQGTVEELLGHTGEKTIFRTLCEESGNIEEIKLAATSTAQRS